MSYLATKLSSSHNRKNFSCGIASLDHYIKTQVTQDIKRKLAACFVVADENHDVKGYYTLSSASIPMEDAPGSIKSKMPRGYTDLPVTLLGRLAVDHKSKEQRLGELLLMDALKRSYDLSGTISSHAIVVDPIDQQAVTFYKKYGFIPLESEKMFITMKTIGALIAPDN